MVLGFYLSGHQPRLVVWVHVIAFVDVYPSDAYCGAASRCTSLGFGDFKPYGSAAEERQFLGPSLGYQSILEDLPGEIVPILTGETLRRAAKFGVNIGVVVWCLYSNTPVFQEVVCSELGTYASEYSSA